MPALFGIIGYPVHHSLSPIMHNAAFRAARLDSYYLAFEVEPRRLADAMRALLALGIRGVNVTIPYKERIRRYLDACTTEADWIGAVNTVAARNGRLIGHNTDGAGFLQAYRKTIGLPLRGQRVLLIGAGGAARAVAMTLVREGIGELQIANRTPARTHTIVRRLRRAGGGTVVEALGLSALRTLPAPDLLINATPLGMKGHGALPVPRTLLAHTPIVCDLVYTPPITPLLRAARETGAKTMGGLNLLLHQGALSFEYWTGRPAPLKIMWAALSHACRQEA